MSDELDLRVIERVHEADVEFRDTLRQRVTAILHGNEPFSTSATASDLIKIDPIYQAVDRVHRHRGGQMVGVAVAVAAAAAAIVFVTSSADKLVPIGESTETSTLPVLDTPETFTDITPGTSVELPDAPISGRGEPAAVWTGVEMIVWGGSHAGKFLDDGAAFNLATGAWRTIARAPISGRGNSGAVWTGSEMIVWGGFIGDDVRVYDGAAYNPTTDSWRLLPPIPVNMGSDIHILSVVWTGDEAVVVGGAATVGYDPVVNEWRRLADPPAYGYPAMWAGDSIVALDSAMMRYNPTTDNWETKDIGSNAALVPIPGAGGTHQFLALPMAIGEPVRVLDYAGDPIDELPPFPGDAALFGGTVGAIGQWVGREALFWIRTGEFPYATRQVWALNPTTKTWRHLDDVLPVEGPDSGARVVAGDVLLAFGTTNDSVGPIAFAYRAGADVTEP